MATAQWPKPDERSLLGTRITRVDGAEKASGAAKYAYDKNLDGMLYARMLPSRYAAAKVNAIDTSAAEAVPGVRGVWIDEGLIGGEVQYGGQCVAAVAAESEEIAAEAVKKIKVDYEPLSPEIADTDPALGSGRAASRDRGDVDAALSDADVVSEGAYGIPVITHCCLEPHGQVADPRDGGMYFWASTQNVSKYADGMERSIDIPQDKIGVECQYIGGGFGSKFSHDKWGIVAALLAKQTGKPIKLMLERDQELMVAGNRPSAYAKVKVGVKNDGTITAFDADMCGTGGQGGWRPPPAPYVLTEIPNWRMKGQRIKTNRGSQRAWRAPGHPQGCLITMATLEDAAAAIGMDALEFFKKNLALTERAEVYAEQLDIAADMIGYNDKAHQRGESGPGPVKRGLGLSIHTWGGLGHPSECDCMIRSDGSVSVKLGSQDLGTGTRTVIGTVAAETFGLPLDAVTVMMGKNAYPVSGASGGSTTIGGVSASTRLASVAALNDLIDLAAEELGVAPESLEAHGGRIQVAGDPSKGMSWSEACGLIGPTPIAQRGVNSPGESMEMGLIDQGVGGVQIADVSVDVETGVVTMNEMAAVQDCGLVVNLKLAESQVYGGLIMGITYALYEEAVYDSTTGRMLNADMEFYRLAGLKDIGELKVHMMTGEKYDSRGVIGLGEPPVISPGAAISNAVANACGTRVPHLPLTPDRVLGALNA